MEKQTLSLSTIEKKITAKTQDMDAGKFSGVFHQQQPTASELVWHCKPYAARKMEKLILLLREPLEDR